MTTDGVLSVQASTRLISLLSAPEFVEMNMNDIVHTVLGWSRPYLSERKTALTIEMNCELPRIRGNQERLTDVLSALLFRAERSSAAGTTGMIRIRSWATDDEVGLSLWDNGFGASRDTVAPDPCLSLTECAEIISDHGGWMYSWRPYSGGASYTIILPVN